MTCRLQEEHMTEESAQFLYQLQFFWFLVSIKCIPSYILLAPMEVGANGRIGKPTHHVGEIFM